MAAEADCSSVFINWGKSSEAVTSRHVMAEKIT
jgi:hypothetical protein